MPSLQELIQIHEQEIKEFSGANVAELENYRIRFLGTKGLVKQLSAEMKNVAPDQRKEAGQLLNAFKLLAEEKYESFKILLDAGTSKGPAIDITLPGTPLPVGTRHPLRIVENQIVSIFEKIGFSVATGPEIEDDWHNFTSLNMPEHHPARDMQDTFYVSKNPDWVLRTHTSSVQAPYWKHSPCRYVLYAPAGFTAMKPFQPVHIVFFTSAKAYTLIRMYLLPI